MKVYVASLAFTRPEILRAGLCTFWATTSDGEYESYTIGDAHYPLNYWACKHILRDLELNQYGIKNTSIVDLQKNWGLHANYNKVLGIIPLTDDDLVVLCDPDEYPAQASWLTAFRVAMEADPKLGWLTLSSVLSDENCERVGYTVQDGGGVRVQIPNDPVINAVCCFRVKALREIGWISEPREFYGYAEIDMIPKLKAAGYKFGCLMDYRLAVNTLGTKQDPEYTAYKRAHVGFSHDDYYKGSFEDFLKEQP